MASVDGIIFDFTFKPDTPQAILDAFEYLGSCGDYEFIDTSKRNHQENEFDKLIESCPESFRSLMGVQPDRWSDRYVSNWLVQYSTQVYAYMHGYNARRFNKETRRFESAASHRFVNEKRVLLILQALQPYLLLVHQGTICARTLYESGTQEKVYWFDGSEFHCSNGFYYKGGDDDNLLHPNFDERTDGWAINEGFKPPMNYHNLVGQGLDKDTNDIGHMDFMDRIKHNQLSKYERS